MFTTCPRLPKMAWMVSEVTDGKSGTRASLPPASYQRPEVLEPGELIVRVVGEDGVDLGEYRFDDLPGPRALLTSLVSGFALAAGPGGRWGSPRTLAENAKRLRRFYRDIQVFCSGIETIEDLTVSAWADWRDHMNLTNRWPGVINSVRVILGLTPGLPEPVRVALRTRNSKPKSRTVVKAYSRAEFLAIKQAAWKAVDGAADRIRAHERELEKYRHAKQYGYRLASNSMRRGELLESLALTGDLPRTPSGQYPHSYHQVRTAAGQGPPLLQALFLAPHEVFAFMILFVMLRGYNPESVDTLTTEHERPDGGVDTTEVMTIGVKKPRASTELQHASDSLVGLDPRSAAGLMRLAIELTEPARAVLRNLGEPTTRLLLCRVHYPSLPGHPIRLSIYRHNATAYWLKKRLVVDSKGRPVRVTLQQLRLTDQVLNRRPRMNSLEVHDRVYVVPEPSTAKASESAIIAGQTEALEHAHATVRLRTLSPSEYATAKSAPDLVALKLGIDSERMSELLIGRLDTAVAACTDFDHSPFSDGGRCTASFLMCLACENAVATPDHLPRLVCLRDALEKIASAVSPEVWHQDYALHYQRLEHLLNSSATSEEIARARTHLKPGDRQAVESLLQRKLDV